MFSLLLLVSCTEALDIQLQPEVRVYLSEDPDRKISLTSSDPEYTALVQWLAAHRSEWYPTSGRYPGGVYVKSGDHGIQVTNKHVVIYSTTGPEPKAIYIQKLVKGELEVLRNLGK